MGDISSCLVWIAFALCSSGEVYGQLSSTYYSRSCPDVLSIVKVAVKKAVDNEKRVGASLLRLHFHDCFVNGCDGSVLLDDSETLKGEKTAGPNFDSARGFEVIDNIKTQVEETCSGVVSCADILAIAARDSVVQLGGPSWPVMVGRRDSLTARLSDVGSNIPHPSFNLTALISSFTAKGLSAKDMTALSGVHTIGQARCINYRDRIYKDFNIDSKFAASLKSNCLSSGSNDNLSPLDFQTPTTFDNNYYNNLKSQKGLLHSDQELFNGGSTDSLVRSYAKDEKIFFIDFANAMVKMGNINPLTGTSGEIRKDCRKPNTHNLKHTNICLLLEIDYD